MPLEWLRREPIVSSMAEARAEIDRLKAELAAERAAREAAESQRDALIESIDAMAVDISSEPPRTHSPLVWDRRPPTMGAHYWVRMVGSPYMSIELVDPRKAADDREYAGPILGPVEPPAAPPPPSDRTAQMTASIPLEQLQSFTNIQARLAEMEATQRAEQEATRQEQARILARKGEVEKALRMLREQSERAGRDAAGKAAE